MMKDTYYELNERAARSGYVDLVDVEAFREEERTSEEIRKLQSAGVHVIASFHNFDRTPDREELIRRLTRMQEMGADVATCPLSAIKGLLNHPLTDSGLKKFLEDYKKVNG